MREPEKRREEINENPCGLPRFGDPERLEKREQKKKKKKKKRPRGDMGRDQKG